jgi:hypothetical protein
MPRWLTEFSKFDLIGVCFLPAPLQVQGEWQCTVGPEGCLLNEPWGLALTPDEDFLLVADSYGNSQRRVVVLRSTDGCGN